MIFNTLIFSDNESQGQSLLSFRSLQETKLITDIDLLQSTLPQIPRNSIHLFQAYLENPLLLSLKNWAQIYSVVQPNGFVKLQFSTISHSDFTQLTKMLNANGFVNKNPINGVLTNELLFSKPEIKSEPLVIKYETQLQNIKINAGADLKNKGVCGEFSYEKLIEVDPNNNQNDLLDEDDLLKNETNYMPFEKKNDDSCATKPKACKNCSCGRKAQEEKEKVNETIKDLETGNTKSSCGNCYLGDAFRCSGCPYRGLPAFKPGDKVTLDLNSEVKEKALGSDLKVGVDGRIKLN